MKLTAVLVLVFCQLQLLAGYPQGITLSLKDVRLPKVFREITKQTGYQFFYNDQMLEGAKTVSVELVNSTLVEALDLCFKDQPFTYTLDKKTVIVMRRKKNLSPEGLAITGKASPGGNESPPPVELRGKVINNKKEALIGASVKIKGISKGTVTDSKGNFTIKADLGQTLVISYVGYDDREIIVSSDKNLTIEMELSLASLLNTVVVNTGYQKASKERYVGSFAQLDSASFNRREGMGIIERLDGTVPGVLFDKKTGSLNTIQIRGISTLGGGGTSSSELFKVLIIVDNFPYYGDINTINPNDVENLTVLKDAAATSIWGAKAGNGVIVITTKKGRYNQPFRISIRSNVTVTEKPNLFLYPQMKIADFIDVEQFLFGKGYYDAKLLNKTVRPVVSPVVEILAKVRSGMITQTQADAQINSLRGVDLRNDLSEYVYQPAIAYQHYINFSGGNNMMNYVLSVGYNHTIPNIQGAKPSGQYTLNSNNSFKPFKNLEIQAGVNLTQSIVKVTDLGLANIYPYAQLVDAQGNHLAVPHQYRMSYLDTAGSGQLLDWKYRPLDEIGLADNSSKVFTMRLNLGATYRINSWLSAGVQYNYNQETGAIHNYQSLQAWSTRNLINQFTNLSQTNPDLRYPVPIGGILVTTNTQSSSHNLRGQFNVNKSWGGRNTLTALLADEVSETNGGYANNNQLYGYNDARNTYKSNIDYYTPYPHPLFGQNSSSTIYSGSTYNKGDINRFISLIANASYTYNNIYTLYASARRDGSNLFGVNTNNRWKPLWSTGVRWDIAKESFYKLKWLPLLSFRASFGYSGNSGGASAFTTIAYVPGDVSSYSITNLSFAQVQSVPNPDLRWEQVRTINLGFDFGLLKNRLSGSLDIYNKQSTGLISNIPFDPTRGVYQFLVNAASLKGHGFELNLNSKNISGKFFKWETAFGLSYANSIVTKLYNGNFVASDFVDYGLHPSVGKPAYAIAAYRWAGLDPLTGDPQGYLSEHVSKDYSDIFNDSVENQSFKGSSIPLYSGYITNSFTWKNISLSANITGRFGFYFRKPSISYAALFSGWQGHADYALRWQKPGDEKFTNIPSMIYPVPSNVSQRDIFYAGSAINLLRGDNIRMQDIRLQYTWDNINRKQLPIKSIQFSLYANNLNLILWRADKSVYDPDFAGGSGSLGAAPPQRTWTLGIGMNF